ncbi:DUF58 domain-containing protein [Glutamicibacter sp. BW78]|uniref:DUF58 domain-containing protein n=1 Tax=Micrococcaceae TaxID=1268 RepID=UPI000BB8A9FE|nr:DUF58 domain-containing protein [Glutamicibacter sp. BW78]PCC24992.1 DUF58 domain-containing protein [Glutamicibacter sp. BW78]
MALYRRFVWLALAGLVPIVLWPGVLTIVVTLCVLVALAGLDISLAASPRSVIIERAIPRSVRLGEPATAQLFLRNAGARRLRGSVRDGWQPSAGARNTRRVVDLPAGERRAFAIGLQPVRRGDLSVHHTTVRSSGPMGLAARQLTHSSEGTLRVLPPFHAKRHLPSKLQRLRELDGRAAIQVRGAGTEFDSLRDYVRGDDVRSIDWRATARRQNVVVRTWRPERDRRVVIVLDTSRTSAARVADEPRLDTGIEASLLLAVLAERGGDRVDFLAYDRRPRARVESASKAVMLNQLVEAMAPLEPELIEADFSGLPAQVRAISTHRSLLVLLTALDSGAVEEGLLPVLPALTSQHVVVIAAVRDPVLDERSADVSDAGAVYRAAAAARTLQQREALKTQLRAVGAEIVDATPWELPPLLADTYIRLKATGRL